MRGFQTVLPLLTMMVSVSCAGGGVPSIPSEPSGELPRMIHGEVTAGGIAVRGDVTTSAAALIQLTLDPVTGATAVESATPRSVQETDDLFLLSLEQFFGPQHLQIDAVSWTAETVDIAYRVLHPFPAPTDPTAPASATNRADLGFAGMLLLLADVAGADGNQYFNTSPEERIVAETALVANADAYYRPAGLLNLPGFTANTFPYKLVVDELLDPRTSQASGAAISNGGNPKGNHSDNLGWRRTTLGPTNDGWTGYGVLHQGQAARNTLSLSRTALADGPVTIDLALIARYVDPRGGATPAEKRANRLPPGGPDYTKFVYREPHGALDVQRLTFLGADTGLVAGEVSTASAAFHIEDWDARTLETLLPNLALEVRAFRVAMGESGLPAVAASIPGVLDLGDGSGIQLWDSGTQILDDDSTFGGDVGVDSGMPGDALCYRHDIAKTVDDAGAGGDYVGLLRAVDVEALLPDPGLVLALDGSLAPLASNIPRPETYQRFQVTMDAPNLAPTVTVDPVGTLLSGTMLQLTVSAYDDPEGNDVYVAFDWNDDGDYSSVGESSVQLTEVPTLFTSPLSYNNGDLVEIAMEVPVLVQDDLGHERLISVAFTLGPNRAPEVSGSPALVASTLPSPGLFTLKQGTARDTDPEGDLVTYSVTNDANGDVVVFESLAQAAANTTPLEGPADTQIIFTVRANDPLHPTTAGTAFPPLTATLSHACPCGWARGFGGIGNDRLGTVAVDSAGNIIVGGNFTGTSDFGGGPRTSSDNAALVIKLDSAGNYLWDRVWGGGSSSNSVSSIAVSSNGDIYAGGQFREAIDFGGGSRTPEGTADLFLVHLGSDGSYQWDGTYGGETQDAIYGLKVSESGDVLFSGHTHTAIDFGGGPRPDPGNQAAFLACLSPLDTYRWDRHFWPGNPHGAEAQALDVDGAGNAYVGGRFSGVLDFGGGERAAPENDEGYVAKYDSNGNWVWDQTWGETGEFISVTRLAINPMTGAPTAGGNFYGSVNLGGGVRTAVANRDAFLVGLTAGGGYVWDRVFGTIDPNADVIATLAATSSSVIANIRVSEEFDFGGGPRLSSMVAYGHDGTFQWAQYNPGMDSAISPGDMLVSVGSFYSPWDADPGPVTYTVESQGADDSYVLKVFTENGLW